MITSLHICGFDIVPDIALQFERGMYAITGETGSGKSVLIGALQSLGDSSMRPGNVAHSAQDNKGRAFIEAKFVVPIDVIPSTIRTDILWEYDETDTTITTTECIIRREFSTSGRSRVFVNDSPSTAEVVEQLCSALFDVHGQHDTQLLVRQAEQLKLIDRFVDQSYLQSYREAYKELLQCKAKLDALVSEQTQLESEREFKQFQFEELSRIDPQPDEYDELEQHIRRAESIERTTAAAQLVVDRLHDGNHSAVDNVQEALRGLKELEQLYPEIADTIAELSSVRVVLEEASRTCKALHLEDISPDELDRLRQRYAELRSIFKKHGGEVATLELYEQLREDLLSSESIEERVEIARTKFAKTLSSTVQLSRSLHKEREQAAEKFAVRVTKIVQDLGMPTAQFHVVVSERSEHEAGIPCTPESKLTVLGANGHTNASFEFASTDGAKVLPLKQAASGGEISRVMLAIKAIEAEAHQVPLMVFDEIDTGISGRVAAQTGRLLKRVANENQILLITHLPQIAAAADHAISVEKHESPGKAFSISAQILGRNERIYEIAKLMSADIVTDESVESAQQLIHQYEELIVN